jgi:RNA polymerase sigma factor (sigma-70 family)
MVAEARSLPQGSAHCTQFGLSVATLFRLYQRPLLRWLRQHMSTPADADDVAQEAWIRLLGYEGSSSIQSPKSMIYRVAANLLCDEARRRKSRRQSDHESLSEESLELTSSAPDVERIVESADAYMAVRRQIDELPPKCRQIFLLSRVHGMSNSQIAAHCSISIKTVEKHMSNALAVLIANKAALVDGF